MTHPRPRAVIFDCDGVLVDSEPVASRLLIDDLARHGLHLTAEDIDARYTGGTMEAVALQARSEGAVLAPDWPARIYAEFYRRLARGVPLIDGIEAVLDRLDGAGIPYAVGSNGALEKMAITLGAHPALRQRLEGRIFSARSLGRFKPDPALYLHAAAALGVDTASCAVIDDSEAGCTAGVRAGMRTLGFAPEGDGARLRAAGAEVFRAMAALPGLLGL